MPKVRISSTGRIIEYGDIEGGVEYNLTTPKLFDVVQANTQGAQVGTDNPEGAVSARHANDLYYETDAKHLWVHTAPTGNTGWVNATAAEAQETGGVGDLLYTSFDVGGLAVSGPTAVPVPFNALYEPDQDGGGTFDVDLVTGIITVLRDCMLDGSAYYSLTPAVSDVSRGRFSLGHNSNLSARSFPAFTYNTPSIAVAGLQPRLIFPLQVVKGDTLRLSASKIDTPAYTLDYAELYLFALT